MKANALTLAKKQAVDLLTVSRRAQQLYMYKFDVDVVFRKGKQDDQQIGKVRYKEDDRPQQRRNQRTGTLEDKRNDVITYKLPSSNDLYVLARSGGVSLFDGISSKLRLGKKDCWWIITAGAKIADGLVIAKDLVADGEGNTHYSIEPDRDMLMSEYIDKLNELKRYMKKLER